MKKFNTQLLQIRKPAQYAVFLLLNVLFSISVMSQGTVTTVPPLTGNNGQTGCSFNVETTTPVLIQEFGQVLNSGAQTVNIWYSPNPVNGAPTISTAAGWTIIETINTTGTNSLDPLVLNTPFLLPQGNHGFYIEATGGVSYDSWSAANQDVFTDGTLTIRTGQNIGYGGAPPNPTFHPRQWNGSITYIPAAQSPADAGITEIVNPDFYCDNDVQDLIVNVRNFGTDQLDSVMVFWDVNGVLDSSWFTLNLDTVNGTGAVDTNLTLASLTLNGPTNITAYSAMPNGSADTVNNNDTAMYSGAPSLSGSYTLDAAGTGANNFTTFQQAADDLHNIGVCGPVVINVANATFNEQVLFEDIPGASSTNTIRFVGQGASNTELTFTQNVSNERYTLRSMGADWVTMDSMTVSANPSGTYGWAVHLMNNSSNWTFENCSILTDTTSTSSLYNAFVVSGSETSNFTSASGVDFLKLNNNIIQGGYNAFTYRTSAGQGTGLEMRNNELDNWYYYGAYLSNNDSITVDSNVITGRPAGTNFASGMYLLNVVSGDVTKNTIQNPGRYGIYSSNSGGTAGFPLVIANNAIGEGFRDASNFSSGIRILGSTFGNGANYIDILNNSVSYDEADGSAFYGDIQAGTDIRIINNSFANTNVSNTSPPFYLSDVNVVSEVNFNNYFSTSGSDFAFYDGQLYSTLTALQAVNNPAGNDTGSVVTNPVFSGAFDLTPQSPLLFEAGTPLTAITTDITGASRPANPSMGAFEFVPAFTEDIALTDATLTTNGCGDFQDTLSVTIENAFGSLKDFTTDTLVVVYEVTGPVNTLDSFVIDTGSLSLGNSITLLDTNIDLSQQGSYSMTAYLRPNAVNQNNFSDTLLTNITLDIRLPLYVTPRIDTVTSPTQLVELSAESPFFPGGEFFITEICHFAGSTTGSPAGGSPAWLGADDYIEITGVPNSDLAGYTLEQWRTGLDGTYTFPAGTVMGPNGTAVFAVGQLGTSTPSPSNYYYHANGTYTGTYGSGTSAGRILFDPSGNIVDAVGYSGYTFPAAANVPATEWSNPLAGGSGSWGIRLEGPDDNTGNNWVLSSSSPQDPNTVNTGVSVPVPSSLAGFGWYLDSVLVDTNIEVNVGPFTASGFYDYVAVYDSTECGTQTDTAVVWVNLTNAQLVSSEDALCNGEASGSAEVESTGGDAPYTYDWFYGNPPTQIGVSGAFGNNLDAGDYLVIINDSNNWPDTVEFTIGEPSAINYNLVDGGSVSCNGDSDGFAEIEGTGGTPPYTYVWFDGTPGAVLSNRLPGQYDVTVTDSNQCDAGFTIDIIEPDPLVLNEDSTGNASCFGYNDAFIALNATGGTTPYTWNWNSGDTSGVLNGIEGGFNYEVTLVDANGCENEADFNITQPDQLDTNVVNTHGSLLTANYNFGDAAFEWWDCDLEQIVTGETNREFEPSDNGNYALIITIDDCQDTSNCHVLDAVSAGDLTSEVNSFAIYPNPNNGLFNVRLTGNGDTDTHMQIVDMQGKVLTDKKLGRIDGELVEEVNLNLAAGVYFVKVIHDGDLNVKRVVVQ